MCPPDGPREERKTVKGKHPEFGYEVDVYEENGNVVASKENIDAYKQHKKDEVARAQREYDEAVARNEEIRRQANSPRPTAVSTARRDNRVATRSSSNPRRSTGYASLRVGSSGATAGPTGVNVP